MLLASTLFSSPGSTLSLLPLQFFGSDYSLPTLILGVCLPLPLGTIRSPPVRPLAGTNQFSWIGISSSGSDSVICPFESTFQGSIKDSWSFWKQRCPLVPSTILMSRAHFLGCPNFPAPFPWPADRQVAALRLQVLSLYFDAERGNKNKINP